ncbi:hypothetical protein QTG64_004295 [Vibrio vulnificus]|uniref:hypothetical protein n=1 Tax=Vibrio sp. 05-20-BW147 TaxID=2575834 RepID=UPI001593DD4D|nr:hypothetical protein [Vibrio sp. 05-20-BW147]ELQ2466514.1 hypothetical protein [Vibrio vulnificus]NVC65386.1 hypothetical protein [Vibrio sp. 05-20-BW147]HDZ3738641.1 hypothetical protein [Vibrio vulnificus]HEB2779473.1 hypothetical protein [Vibrio vulnificus]
MPSHEDIHISYLEKNQSILNSSAINAAMNAYKLLEKTSIYGKIAALKLQNEKLKEQTKTGGLSISELEKRAGETFETMELMKSCYNGIADDLLLFASFEHVMCSKLLKDGYVIHRYDNKKKKVSDLDVAEQKVSVESLKDTATLQCFKSVTINGSILLKPDYISLLSPDGLALNGLEALKDRRNRSHFDSRIYSFSGHSDEFFACIELIIKTVEDEFRQYWPER